MDSPRQPRIRIEDLPPPQPLTEEEMARVIGAGRFRPSFEPLEGRQLLTGSLSATLTAGVLQVNGVTVASGVSAMGVAPDEVYFQRGSLVSEYNDQQGIRTVFPDAQAMGVAGNKLYALRPGGLVSSYDDQQGTLTSGTSSVEASDGSIWYLGTATVDSTGNYAIYRLSGGQVTQMPGSANSLGVAEGTVWALNGTNSVSSWSGSNWVQQSAGQASDGSVWFLGNATVDALSDKSVYYWSNHQLHSANQSAIGLGNWGSIVWITNAAGQIMAWNGTGWTMRATVAPGPQAGTVAIDLSGTPIPVAVQSSGSPTLAPASTAVPGPMQAGVIALEISSGGTSSGGQMTSATPPAGTTPEWWLGYLPNAIAQSIAADNAPTWGTFAAQVAAAVFGDL